MGGWCSQAGHPVVHTHPRGRRQQDPTGGGSPKAGGGRWPQSRRTVVWTPPTRWRGSWTVVVVPAAEVAAVAAGLTGPRTVVVVAGGARETSPCGRAGCGGRRTRCSSTTLRNPPPAGWTGQVIDASGDPSFVQTTWWCVPFHDVVPFDPFHLFHAVRPGLGSRSATFRPRGRCRNARGALTWS